MNSLTEADLLPVPKVALHEHLDGGLRPQTIIELAREQKVELPTTRPDELADWFFRGANRGSLPLYLEGFGVTISVMQTAEALARTAFELLEDMHKEGMVYAELRFAPVFHTQGGLNLEQVVAAVALGMEKARKSFGIESGLIVCAMRDRSDSLEMAELALDFRDRGVVGFDIAGEEAGHPPKRHLQAFQLIQRENFNITIHAGEAFGMESIWQAVQFCGAHRLGHATRLAEDIVTGDGKVVRLGRLAQYVLDHRIPLEICLSSNVHTGAAPSIEKHPFGLYYAQKFRLTLNTDNRLMSRTTQTKEMLAAHRAFGLGLADLEKLTINAMKSAFIPYDRRCAIIYDRIKPGYRAAAERLAPRR